MQDSLMHAYARLPVAFRRGKGAWLEDEDGRHYLDALAGIAVCALGHAHPAVTAAIAEQAGALLHTSNAYRIPAQEALASRLCKLAGMNSVFFGNSGAEANEAAIKLARLHAHRRGIREPSIMVMEGAFHGRTVATLTASGSRKVQAGYDPLLSGFARVPYNDLGAAARAGDNQPNLVAVLVEPVQGERGVVVPNEGYLAGLRRLCDERGWLLMLDEIQTGMGRTGKWFAFQHESIQPDVLTLAKALANGVPIGACLARGDVAETFEPGNHGSTFGGNPLACRAGLAVLDTMEAEDLPARAAVLGERMLRQLQDGLSGHKGVIGVRGHGLMLGVELDRPCRELMRLALEQGLLLSVASERTIRLLPPLIISDEEADRITDTVIRLAKRHLAA